MALLLRDIVGLSYTEIADSLEVTLATVKWRIYKAREDVQVALAREGIVFYGDEAEEDGRAGRSHRRVHDLLTSASRSASSSGSPASRISACVRAMSYSRGGSWRGSRRGRAGEGGPRIAVARLADRAGVH